MAKLGEKVVQKITNMNEKLKNGFSIDIEKYVISGDFVPSKTIKLDDNSFLKIELWFMPEYENFKKVGINVEMNIGLYKKDPHSPVGMYVSKGLGQTIKLKSGLKRQVFKEMAEQTEILTDDFIMSHYDEAPHRNARIL